MKAKGWAGVARQLGHGLAAKGVRATFSDRQRRQRLVNLDAILKSDVDSLLATIQQADAITLEAEPGGGKTTALFELAARLLDDGTVPIFVPLP
jgi:hypothetical protein